MPRFRRASELLRRATGGRVNVEWRHSDEVERESERLRLEREQRERSNGRLFGALLAIAVAAAIAGLALAWPTWFGMNHAAGNVAAVSDAMLHGESPGRPRAGALVVTLYFPGYPALVALARFFGLEWRDALRATSALGLALAVLSAAWVAVALGGGRAGALLAAALALGSGPVALAGLAGRADLFGAAFSTAAFASWLRGSRRDATLAPLLAALAWAFKPTAVALPAAFLLDAWLRRRPFAGAGFALRFAAGVGVALLALAPVQGATWLAEALRLMGGVPPGTVNPLRGPAESIRYLGAYSELAVVAAAAISIALAQRKVALYLGVSTAVALAVMGNRLADHNHLIEPLIAAAGCAGALAAGTRGELRRFAIALAAIVVIAPAWRNLHSTWRHAREPRERREAVLAAIRAEPGEVLTEDPLLALAAGRRPVLSDAGLARSLAWRGDARMAPLHAALAEGRYGLVVLHTSPDDPVWYRDFHFGETAGRSLRESYAVAAEADGYTLVRPR